MINDIQPLSDRKEEILLAARKRFSEKGYASASMRHIAEDLGIEAASLYSSFKSKDDILWEIARRCARDFFVGIEPIFSDTTLSPETKLTHMLEAHIEVVLANQDASTIFFDEWKHLKEPRNEQYGNLQKQYAKRFQEVIRQGTEKGVFRAVEGRFVTTSLLSAINWIARWYRPTGRLTIEQIKEELLNLLMNGLRGERSKNN